MDRGARLDVFEVLSKSRRTALRARLRVTDEELRTWSEMSRKMFVPYHDGVISQFEGYEDLEELDWEHYRTEYGNIGRMDRILRAEGRDPDAYKVAKQADTVMLFFLFDDAELRQVIEQLGYPFGRDLVRRTVDYYDQRTSHGSTLSHVTFAGVLATFDPQSSWLRFKLALESDVSDLQGGTTKEGIHMGVMGGTLDLVQRYYVGAVRTATCSSSGPSWSRTSTGCRSPCGTAALPYGCGSTATSCRCAPRPRVSGCRCGSRWTANSSSSAPAESHEFRLAAVPA